MKMVYMMLALTLAGCAGAEVDPARNPLKIAEDLRVSAQKTLVGGNPKLAQDQLKEAIAVKVGHLHEEHPDLLGDYLQMANLHQGEGSHEQAEGFFNKALKIIGKGVGFVTPFASSVVDNLAGLYIRQGRHADAEKTFRNALAEIKKTHGADHPAAIEMMEKLAYVKELSGDYKESLALYEDAYKAKKTRLGSSDRQVADLAHTLGKKYQQQGDLARAESMLTEALENGKRSFGGNHIRTTQMTKDLGKVLVSSGKEDKAIALYGSSMKEKNEKLQLVGGDMIDYLEAMAQAHELRGEKREAALARAQRASLKKALSLNPAADSLELRRPASE